MEPISVGFLTSAVIGSIIGNRSDELFCRVMRVVQHRLRQGGKPVNHDLQKAVRKAYLQATLALLNARLLELGVDPVLLKRDIRRLFRLSEEPKQLLEARRAVLNELKQIPKASYLPPSSEAEQQMELLLQPRGGTAAQRISEFQQRLKEELETKLTE